MEHLPTFKDATPYPRVPYLGGHRYENCAFKDYPDSQRWDLNRLQLGDFSPPPNPVSGHNGFLQDWLYFGILHDLSAAAGRKPPEVIEFVTKGKDDEPKITTRKLNKLIQKSVSSIARSKKKKEAPLTSFNEVLDIANTVVDHLQRLAMNPNGQQCPLPTQVVLSIMVLGSSIDQALMELNLYAPGRRTSWYLAPVGKRSMQNNSWCRRDIALAGSHLSELSMFCASPLQRNNQQPPPAHHDGCSEVACETRQTNTSHYRSKHVTDACNCESWQADTAALQEIIREGRIPYIQLKRDTASRENSRPRVCADLKSLRNSAFKSPANRLVIFSHVWSDGLGNPAQNAMPICQLERFYDMLHDSPWRGGGSREKGNRWQPVRKWLNTSINIWIDTLCIPTIGEERQEAIRMLNRYFSFASMTVVLDQELCALEHKKYSTSELLLRIGLSGWMSRCWTMQEAIIAGGSLAVYFADGWFFLMDKVASVQLRSKMIRWYALSKTHRTELFMIAGATALICPILLMTALYIYFRRDIFHYIGRGFEEVSNHLKDLVWSDGPNQSNQRNRRRQGNTDRPRKRWFRIGPIKPHTVPDAALADFKSMFGPISTLCQDIHLGKDGAERQRMVLSWHGLSYRNTSHQCDRFMNFAFGCARSVKDYRLMKEVLILNPQDRLRQWLLEQDTIPSGLLFLRCPRVNERGFQWAPSDVHPGYIDDDDPAKCLLEAYSDGGVWIPRGSLQLNKPGLLWEQSDTRQGRSSWVLSDPNLVLQYEAVMDQSEEQPQSQRNIGPGHFAIIFSHEPSRDDTITGVVLANAVKRQYCYTGDFLCRVFVRALESTTTYPPTVVVAKSLPKCTKWVVS